MIPEHGPGGDLVEDPPAAEEGRDAAHAGVPGSRLLPHGGVDNTKAVFEVSDTKTMEYGAIILVLMYRGPYSEAIFYSPNSTLIYITTHITYIHIYIEAPAVDQGARAWSRCSLYAYL